MGGVELRVCFLAEPDSRPPETNIEIATNQKAGSAAPVRLAASARPSAPMA